MNSIMKSRVMSKNVVIDIVARVKNFFGMRITQYEDLIEKAKKEIFDELDEEGIVLSWHRYQITELTNGALVIMLYGEEK